MNGFTRGLVAAACIKSLYQDMLGKEEYLRITEVYWADWTVTVPLAIAMLVCVFGPWKSLKWSSSTDDRGNR